MSAATFRIWRGEGNPAGDGKSAPPTGSFTDYQTEVSEGMVVLDAVHRIQAESASDLAVRWNCKAGKCGSCSAEINGNPRLMCMTRLNTLDLTQPVTIEPMRAFPLLKDLVTDVSWNFRVKQKIQPFKPRKPDAPDGTWRMQQSDIDRVQTFRKCIECFLCQDVCHVLRDHQKHDEFVGPRFLTYVAALEMHPLDTADRIREVKDAMGSGYCNITKCCTKVCPEHIPITDDAIIPLKERVVDEFYDPVTRLLKMFRSARMTGLTPGRRRVMFDLKPLSKNAVPAALAKAERYRLLNEPMQAASICEDVLRVEPDNAAARVALILALSDEFSGAEQTAAMARARTLLPGLPTEYERAYYSGILAERRALAQLEQGGVSAGFSAYEGLREAMDVVRKGRGACVRRTTTTPSCAGTPAPAS